MDVWLQQKLYSFGTEHSPRFVQSSSSAPPPPQTQVQDEIWAIIIILLFHQLFVVVVTPELLPVFNSIRSSLLSFVT